MLLREAEVYRVNRHKGGFSIKISLERTESCCSPPWMARRSRKRERETEKEVQKGWLNAARAQINRRVCGSQWGKLLTSSRSLRYSSHRTTPILFEFVQLRPRFLHNANYNLCAIPRSNMRASLFHSLLAVYLYRGTRVCTLFPRGGISRRWILYLPPTFRYPIFRPIYFFSFFLFFSFLAKNKEEYCGIYTLFESF